eukprot:jgi/Chrzof1/11310/Cz05g32010.t1
MQFIARLFRPASRMASARAKQLVEDTINSHPVTVFSKSFCPYCHKAKRALNQFLQPDQYFVMELDQVNEGDDIQDALLEKTGGRSVPRVFVGGKFIGGGDDTAAKAANGELERLLKEQGLIK